MVATAAPLIADLGAPELLITLVVVLFLVGASKLPDLARGTGQALRIFKTETRGLMTDADDSRSPSAVTSGPTSEKQIRERQAELDRLQAELDAERERLGDTPI